MNFSHIINAVDSHTMGEATRVVTSGIGHIPGASMQDKKIWVSKNRDNIRKMLMLEPRGHQDMFGAIITEPVSAEADAGVIFMDTKGYLDMCGHGSMGTVLVLLETGMIPFDKKVNSKSLALDTPAGVIHARAQITDGRISEITIRNRESFFEQSSEIVLDSIGPINVDIAYGGNYFALVNADLLNLEVKPSNITSFKKLGLEIRDKVNKNFNVIDPGTKAPGKVNLVEIYENSLPPRNIVVFGQGQIDRSPCGTGTSAKMALLHHQGHLKIGEPYIYQSVFGTEFRGKIIKETFVNGKSTIIPEISGNAFITGFQQFVADENDPYKFGFGICE
ncbi:MAG: proline racemase family protein [Deltaproteobacteria bacterium]|jgi:proline racemase|nr:proline racemase family protein [Deltaproteobacteria bacterium]